MGKNKSIGIRGSDKHKRMWSHEKNGDMPLGVGCHNDKKKYWWKCSECNNLWQGSPQSIYLRRTEKCRSCSIDKPDNLLGKKIGKWTVIERTKNKEGKGTWLCRCECGTERLIRGHQLKNTNKCSNCHIKEVKKYDKIAYQFWRRIECGAKRRNLDFSITIDDAYDLFLEQEKRCALTGDTLLICTSSFHWERERSGIDNHASLDRIDSSKGYISGNIQWVRKDVNMRKGTMGQDDFILLCQKVSNYFKAHK